MKLTFILLTAAFLNGYAHTSAQSVTLSGKDIPLKRVFNTIKQQTDYVVFTSKEILADSKPVSLSVSNMPLVDFLDFVLKNQPINYRIEDKTIMLAKKLPTRIQLVALPSLEIPLLPPPIDVTIVVQDSAGQPLEGASIRVKGTQRGITTDANGHAVLKSIASNSTLVISFTGYSNKEVKIGGNITITIRLTALAKNLEEIVVVGYGTQKKVNVTGAISTVSGTDILKSPVENVTSALIGTATGVSGLQASGEPGQNANSIYIRGVSTYGNSQPLIVIDGVEQPAEQAYSELNGMDPNEIEGISVLKDAASTAVYGIRGANGVIIVTTKRGKKGKPVFNLSVNSGSTQAVNFVKEASPYEWASMRNTAINISANDLGNVSYSGYLFTPDQLWKIQNNRDYTPAEVSAMTNLTAAQQAQLNASPALYYGNTDRVKQMYGNKGPQKQINFNVSGGNDLIDYYVSLGYFTQIGIGPHVKYGGDNTESSFDRYNFKSNFDIHVNKNTEIALNLTGQFGTTSVFGAYYSPYDLVDRYKTMDQYIEEGNPLNMTDIIDGKLVEGGAAGTAGSSTNPLGLQNVNQTNAIYELLVSGDGILINTLIDDNVKITHKMDYLTKGLSIHATADYQNNYQKQVAEAYPIPTYSVQRDPVDPTKLDFFGGSYGSNSYSSSRSTWNKIYFDAGIDYNRTFGNHKVTALFLGKAQKYSMPSDGFHTPSGLMGLVGRLTYNYKERYMLEYDLGYNGTEQFASGQRFGYFPAYSVGWVPTSEPFFKENKWITFLKIRGSYGEVGNDLLGSGRRYLYLPSSYTMNLSSQGYQGYFLGNSNGSAVNPYYPGTVEGSLGDPNITWEKSKKVDIGLDSRFFSDRLSLTADYFHEVRSNILTTLGILPLTFGVTGGNVPPANVGETLNRGYELSLDWKDKIGQVGYSMKLGVSYAKNKIIYEAEAPNPYPWMDHTGFPLGQYFGLVSDGFFNTPQELANRPYNSFTSNVATLGDIRYKDLNGDGIIDNKDIAPIGYSNLPQYHFNATLGVNYKGFNVSVLLIGSANGSYYLNSGYTIPYQKAGSGNLFQWQYDGQWTAAKAASGASITSPRPIIDATGGGGNVSNSDCYLASDFWLKSNNFFRIKNLEVGYTLPSGLLKHLQISRLRLYVNANNIFTFNNALTKYGVDPEQTDTNSSFLYPLTKVFNIGLNVQF